MKHPQILVLIAVLGAAAVGLPSLRGATITVVNANDNGSGSLRQALADAVDGDTINFDPSLNRATITLNGELVVGKSVTIDGPGANQLYVNGNHGSRVFHISSGKTVAISRLTVTYGSAPPPNYFGGGIYNDHATLTVSNCRISSNSADSGVGGGIYNDQATLTLNNCTLVDNSAWYGGGISTNWLGGGAATVTIINSTFFGNSAIDWGGGVLNDAAATLTIIHSTLSGNWSLDVGGGIFNEDSTTLTITHSTLSGNSAAHYGGGFYNEGGTLEIGHTILDGGSSGANIYNVDQLGTVISLGYNLSSDNGGGYLTATGDQINTDPRLGPLQDNGGPTFTHLPASDSPAIDAGDPTLGMDQRGLGFLQVVNGRIDIGATEVQATSTPTPTATPKPHGGHH